MVYSESRERRRVKHKRERVNTPCRNAGCIFVVETIKYILSILKIFSMI